MEEFAVAQWCKSLNKQFYISEKCWAVGGKMTAVINRHFTGGGSIFTPELPLIPPSSAHSFEYARAN